MLYLSLSIVFSTLVILLFKYFDKIKVDLFQAIFVNYLVAATFGFALAGKFSINQIVNSDWFPYVIVLGILFISMFFLMGLTAQKSGVSVSSVANKMSVVIPISFSIVLYNESLTLLKLFGILLALAGVFMASIKPNRSGNQKSLFIYPLILFVGSGFLDTLLKYTQGTYLGDDETKIFVPSIFLIAAIIGTLVMTIKVFVYKHKPDVKSSVAGIALGLLNFISILFFVKSLELKNIESSVVFSVNNMAIVIASSVCSFFIFKENMSYKNWLGILFSIIAIGIISAGT